MLKISWHSSWMGCTRIWMRMRWKVNYVSSLQMKNADEKECLWLTFQISNGIDINTITTAFLWNYFKDSLLAVLNVLYVARHRQHAMHSWISPLRSLCRMVLTAWNLRNVLMHLSKRRSWKERMPGRTIHHRCLTELLGIVQLVNDRNAQRNSWELLACQLFLSSIWSVFTTQVLGETSSTLSSTIQCKIWIWRNTS